jgi:acyl-CoA thioesterase
VGLDEMTGVLALDETGPDRYRGRNLSVTPGVIFGGQLLAQAIAAAASSVPEMHVKSMHTLFLRGGRPDEAVSLDVDRLHLGRTFGNLEVSIRQGDRLCTRSLVLLHRPDEELIAHQDHAPGVTAPDAWSSSTSAMSAATGWDVRVVDGVDISDPAAVGPPDLHVWSRFPGAPALGWMAQALLGYASDGFLIGTAMRPHAGVGQALAHVSISTSVISQTLVFHDTFDADEWLLLAHHSPYAGGGRSFGRADVFTVDGRMVASYSQENMIRAYSADSQPAPGERAKA